MHIIHDQCESYLVIAYKICTDNCYRIFWFSLYGSCFYSQFVATFPLYSIGRGKPQGLGLRIYSWLCDQGSFQDKIEGPCNMLGSNPRKLHARKVLTLPAVLSPVPRSHYERWRALHFSKYFPTKSFFLN